MQPAAPDLPVAPLLLLELPEFRVDVERLAEVRLPLLVPVLRQVSGGPAMWSVGDREREREVVYESLCLCVSVQICLCADLSVCRCVCV